MKQQAVSAGIESRLDALRRAFAERLWKGMLVIACFGIPISVLRALDTGWLTVYSIHIALGVLVAIITGLRRQLPYRWLSGLFIALLWMVGIPGVLTYGLAASSVLWIVLSCLIASYLFTSRVALYVAIGAASVLALIGLAMVTQRIQPEVNLDSYVHLPTAWATLLFATGAFVFFVIRSVGAQNETLVQLLQELDEQKRIIELTATHDHLTGLPTMRLVNDRLSIAVAAANRANCKVALMFLDLDGFKPVNDRFGHDAGDDVLREVARRMLQCVRGSDTVARIGGDEFLIVAGDVHDLVSLQSLAQKLIDSIAQPFQIGEDQVTIGASVGISLYPDHSTHFAELRRLADIAMYESKQAGKGSYRFAKNSPH